MKILLKNLPGQDQASKSNYCEEFFNLITSIVRTSGENFVLEPAAQDKLAIAA